MLYLKGAITTNDKGLCGQSLARHLNWSCVQFPEAARPHIRLVTPSETFYKEVQLVLHQVMLTQADS